MCVYQSELVPSPPFAAKPGICVFTTSSEAAFTVLRSEPRTRCNSRSEQPCEAFGAQPAIVFYAASCWDTLATKNGENQRDPSAMGSLIRRLVSCFCNRQLIMEGGDPTEGLILHNPQRLQLFCLTEIISAAFQTLSFVPGGDAVATGKAVLNQAVSEQYRRSDELKSKCFHYGGDLCDLCMLACMLSRKRAHVASADFYVN